jgi:hypothetical protein
MIPIRVKFDRNNQQFKLVEDYKGHLFEDGDDYCLVMDKPNVRKASAEQEWDCHFDDDYADSTQIN